MARPKKATSSVQPSHGNDNGGNLDFEAKLWAAADKLRGSMDASEYMIELFKGRVFDPFCGSGGMFVQSEKFVVADGGRINDISVYGQESNHTTWRLCEMNLAFRGIEGKLKKAIRANLKGLSYGV